MLGYATVLRDVRNPAQAQSVTISRRDYRDLIPAGGGGPGVIDSITGVATGRGPPRDTL